MWTRAELKSNAKTVLRSSYWESVVAFLVYGVISIGASLVAYFVPFGGIAGTIFLMLPLSVGLNFFFMQNQIAPSSMQNIFYAFKSGGYMKIAGAMAWMYLFIFLWSLIAVSGIFILLVKFLSSLGPYFITENLNPGGFVTGNPFTGGFFSGSLMTDFSWLKFDSSWIPALIAAGVIYLGGLIIAYIKGLSYSMTAYILTDNPNIGYERALKLSIAMTLGHKWEMFVLGLSFIGWGLLALLTFGIGFLFLAPYVAATNAQLYVKLRDIAINCGLTSPQELNVYQK